MFVQAAPAPELPAELWEDIVSYLPETFVRNLYSVNRPLLHIALNLRYKVACINDADIYRTLLSSSARGRARKVVIKTNNAYSSIHDKSNKKRLGWQQRFFLKLRLFKTTLPWNRHQLELKKSDLISSYYEQMINAVVALDRVQEIDYQLQARSEQYYSTKLQFTRGLLGASFEHISKLSLNCSLEDWPLVMTPDILLPRLSTLRLSFCTAYTSSDPADFCPMVQAFLTRHFSTIETLQLIFSYMVDPSIIIGKLPKHPLLSSFLLRYHVLSLEHTYFAAIKDFISQHKDQLRSMAVYVQPHPFIHLQAHTEILNTALVATLPQFSGLNELTLGLHPKSAQCANVKRQLERYQLTLTSLQLHTSIWTYSHIQHVFSGVVLNLQQLALTVACLSPPLLTFLANTFPSLKHLVLNIAFWISSNPDASHSHYLNAVPFSSAPPESTDTLRTWELQSITLIHLSPHKQIRTEDRAHLVRSLPHVRTFCDMDPEAYATAEMDPGIGLKKNGDFWGQVVRNFDML